MKPKEKARQLVDDFDDFVLSISSNMAWKPEGIKCALRCVDEIIETYWGESYKGNKPSGLDYWEKVKQEIEKL